MSEYARLPASDLRYIGHAMAHHKMAAAIRAEKMESDDGKIIATIIRRLVTLREQTTYKALLELFQTTPHIQKILEDAVDEIGADYLRRDP